VVFQEVLVVVPEKELSAKGGDKGDEGEEGNDPGQKEAPRRSGGSLAAV
jgi:hypothetical protein